MAVGRESLEHLDWEGLKDVEVRDYLKHSVFDVHAGKMYFASKEDWWRVIDPTPQLTISDTPLRQTFHFAKSKMPDTYVLNAGYMDSNTCKTLPLRRMISIPNIGYKHMIVQIILNYIK